VAQNIPEERAIAAATAGTAGIIRVSDLLQEMPLLEITESARIAELERQSRANSARIGELESQNQALQRTVKRLSREFQGMRCAFSGLQTRLNRLEAVSPSPTPFALLIAPDFPSLFSEFRGSGSGFCGAGLAMVSMRVISTAGATVRRIR
jgi:hypothetical protein